jgi:4-amino-4-deoxy-L-arabinose transferase-like glycosyltransferase
VAIAGLLRFYLLGRQGIWNDEMFSLDIARSPIGELMGNLRKYNHPPLFFLLLQYILHLFGDTAWSLRILSAFTGALTCGFAYLISSKLFKSYASGIIAGILCAFSPFHLAYSQEGRPYALAALLCLLSFYFLYLSLNESGRRNYAFYIIASVALLYTHHWGTFVILTQVILVFLWKDISWNQRKIFLLEWCIIGLCYLPEAIELRHKLPSLGPAVWFWVEKPNPYEIIQLAGAYSGSYFKFASSIFSEPLVLRILGIASIFALALTPLFLTGKEENKTNLRFSLVCFYGTLLIPFIISFFRPEIFLWYRYTVIVFPLFCVIAGGLVVNIRLRNTILSIALILLLVESFGTVRYYTWSKSNTKEVASYVETLARRGYPLIVRPKYYAPLLNYYYKDEVQQVDESYLDSSLGTIVDTTRKFVYVSLNVPNEIRDYFDLHFDRIEQQVFPGEANMGIIVGVYRHKVDSDTSGTSAK